MKREAYYQSEDLLNFIAEGWNLSSGKPPEGVVVTDEWDQWTKEDFERFVSQYNANSRDVASQLKAKVSGNSVFSLLLESYFEDFFRGKIPPYHNFYLLVLAYHFLQKEGDLDATSEAKGLIESYGEKLVGSSKVSQHPNLKTSLPRIITLLESLKAYTPGDSATTLELVQVLKLKTEDQEKPTYFGPWVTPDALPDDVLIAVNQQFFDVIEMNRAYDAPEFKNLIGLLTNKRTVTLNNIWMNELHLHGQRKDNELKRKLQFQPYYEKIRDYKLQYKASDLTKNQLAYLEFKMLEQLFLAWGSISNETTDGLSLYHLFEIYEHVFSLLGLNKKADEQSFHQFLQDNFKPGQKVGLVNPILRSQFDFEYCGSWHVIREIDRLIDESQNSSRKSTLEQLRNDIINHERFGLSTVDDYVLWILFIKDKCDQGGSSLIYRELQSSIQSGRESIQNRYALANSVNQRVSIMDQNSIAAEVIEFYRVAQKTPWDFLGINRDATESQVDRMVRKLIQKHARSATGLQVDPEATTNFQLYKAAQKILTDKQLMSDAIRVNEDRSLLEKKAGVVSTRLALTFKAWTADSPKMTNDKYLKLVRLLALCEKWPVEKYWGLFSLSAPSMIEDLKKILNAIKDKSFDGENRDVIGNMFDRAYRRLVISDYPQTQDVNGPKAALLSKIILLKGEMAKIENGELVEEHGKSHEAAPPGLS